MLAWRVLVTAQLRETPGRSFVTLLAIALGVALGAAVYLTNSAALDEFGLAAKRLFGEADVVVRGPREGFAEALYVRLAQEPAVEVASPVLELDVALPGSHDTLKVLGLDTFRAASLQPRLIGDLGARIPLLFARDGILLSAAAARDLRLRTGDALAVVVGSATVRLKVLGVLAPDTYPQPLGIMDIASAQWIFERVGWLNRVDLRLRHGVDSARFRAELAPRLPAGVLALAPDIERDRAITLTRAYRLNLNMLALVALLAGALLVFSTQSLSVLRRRRSLGLLRALGITRGQLLRALVGEGAALGAAGGLLGVALGTILAALLLHLLSGDLGNGQLRVLGAAVPLAPLPMLGYCAIGMAVAALGGWIPARAAARQPPAQALKGGEQETSLAQHASLFGLGLFGAGVGLAFLPRLGGLPLFGYVSIACLLFGAVLLVPALTRWLLALTPRSGRVVLDTAVAQLQSNVAQSTLSLASIIVSFSLMVAMAIMVYSFRDSFDHWLGKLLPADVQLREPPGNDTAYLSAADQARIAAVKGVARVEFRRTRQLLLEAARPPITLIARDMDPAHAAEQLPLVDTATHAAAATPRPGEPRAPAEPAVSPNGHDVSQIQPAWISESVQDNYGYRPGDRITLPLAGRPVTFVIAGEWRDYARSTGAVVITRRSYTADTGDDTANEGSVWLDGRLAAADVEAGIRSAFAGGATLELLTSTALRERSLRIFDRAFAITYGLEAIAVIIGLAGVSFAASSTALARRAEFGMLRHVGMLRRQVIGMLAGEGMLLSLFGVTYGLGLGAVLSLVLVYVINRQSFNWSIDLAVPWWQLAALSAVLVLAAALTAVWSGRAALGADAVRAVREDW